MSILEGMELNWVQYQINHGIEMRYNSNSIVWMSLYWSTSMENNSIHFYVWMYKHGIGICSHLPPSRRTLLRQQSLPSRHTGEWWRPSWIHAPLLDPRDQRGAEEVLTGGGALPRTEVGEELHGSPAEGHGLTAEGG